MVSACTLTPKCPSVVWMLAADVPIPDSIRASVMYRRGTWRCSKPGLSFGTAVRTWTHLYLCLFSCLPRYHPLRTYLFFLHPGQHSSFSSSVNLPAECGLRRYEQRVLDRRDMLAPAPLSGGVVGALARGTVSRKRDHTTIRPPHSGMPRPSGAR